jgi:hypothetical protein
MPTWMDVNGFNVRSVKNGTTMITRNMKRMLPTTVSNAGLKNEESTYPQLIILQAPNTRHLDTYFIRNSIISS